MVKACFEALHIGGGAHLLDLPPPDTGAKCNVLLAADGNHGDGGAGTQRIQHRRFHPLVHGQPLAADNKVAVVAHTLRLVLAHARLQQQRIIVGAKQAADADDRARAQQIPVCEGGLDPLRKEDARSVRAAQRAIALGGARIIRAACRLVD